MSTIDITGSGDASDRARFHNCAALRIPMTNAIAAAKTIIANRPLASKHPKLLHKPFPPLPCSASVQTQHPSQPCAPFARCLTGHACWKVFSRCGKPRALNAMHVAGMLAVPTGAHARFLREGIPPGQKGELGYGEYSLFSIKQTPNFV